MSAIGHAHIIDLTKSDPLTHTYCCTCAAQVPPFLKRTESVYRQWSQVQHETFDYCEACGAALRPGVS